MTKLKAYSWSKLSLYNLAKALDGEIHLLEESEQILENKVESGIQGLIKVELSWAKCKDLLASAEKKATDVVLALLVTNIITNLVSLK